MDRMKANTDKPKPNRREFLVRVGGAAVFLTVAGAGLGHLRQSEQEAATESVPPPTDTPAAEVTETPDDGKLPPAPGTRAEYPPVESHFRLDIARRLPEINADDWWLEVTGLVAAPLAFTLDDLTTRYEPVHQVITLACISNPVGGPLIGTTRWTGIPLHVLLDDWGVSPDAQYLKISSADDFFELIAIDMIRKDDRIMLAYAWDDQPLPIENGFPLRLYVPDRYGMKLPKWITRIEAIQTYEEGYWVRRNWTEEAIVQHTTIIDTVAVESAYERDGQTWIPIGGIAYAGARGVAKVEVRVDDGDWVEAALREPLSELTWVIWRYDWPFEAGRHTFCVRCVDGEGHPQVEQSGNREPDGTLGAPTGLHCVRKTV